MRLSIIAALLALLIGTADAQVSNPPAGQTLFALGGSPSYSSGIVSNTITGSGGINYAAGDTVTLTCSGCAISTAPTIVVGSVSGGVPTNIQLRVVGDIRSAPSPLAVTFTQTATSGSGTGLVVTGNLQPLPGFVLDSLASGGGVINGSMYLALESPLASLYGAENTFGGDRAGGNFTGNSVANTAFGHNAAGVGLAATGLTLGSFNTCLGNDACKNIYKTGLATVNSVTAVGQNSFRGGAAGMAGGFNSGLGAGTGQAVTSGGFNTLAGYLVGGATLTTGSNNLLLGTGSNCDTAAAGTSNTIQLCAGSTAIFQATGAGTPATSIAMLAGALQVGSTTALTLAGGEVGMPKITASGSAPGAAGAKMEWVCGTNAGSMKLISYAGTSTTPVTIIDNVGTGGSGC